MNFSSPSSTRFAFGPGRAVLILGPIVAVMVLVVMGISSVRQQPVVTGQVSLNRTSGVALVQACYEKTPRRIRRRKELIATEERRTQPRRQIRPIPPWTDQAV